MGRQLKLMGGAVCGDSAAADSDVGRHGSRCATLRCSHIQEQERQTLVRHFASLPGADSRTACTACGASSFGRPDRRLGGIGSSVSDRHRRSLRCGYPVCPAGGRWPAACRRRDVRWSRDLDPFRAGWIPSGTGSTLGDRHDRTAQVPQAYGNPVIMTHPATAS